MPVLVALPVRSGGQSGDTLRALAVRRHVAVGAAVNIDALRHDARYQRTLAAQYNMVTPENAMKWDTIHPAAGAYDFGPADEIVAFATTSHMQVRGHNLVWDNQNPDWLQHGTWTRDQLLAVLHDHIATVVGHYRGHVEQWDVVNEAVDFRGMLIRSIWLRVIGPDYLDLAFRWAHEADPSAQLFLNEDTIGVFPGAKNDVIVALVTGMTQRGVPIDGVGIQTHTDLYGSRLTHIATLMSRLRALGLEVAITELDVRLPDHHTEGDLAHQARIYRQVLRTCLQAPNCHTFVTWGFTDRYSWIPTSSPGYGTALPFDTQYRPKPAFDSLKQVLRTTPRRP
jgi:endo-1,4-beta-xylanase